MGISPQPKKADEIQRLDHCVNAEYNLMVFTCTILFFGRFHQFGDGDRHYGHINPIAADELRYIVEKCNMKIVKIEEGGYLPRLWIRKCCGETLKNIFGFVWSFRMKGVFRGWCIIALINNVPPNHFFQMTHSVNK